MSYLVLARKWRPQTFADLVGQEHVSQTLGNAIQTGRVHHAFLFTGARGVGKTSAARIFAKALNCEAGLSATPCNICPSCVGITAGQNMDVIDVGIGILSMHSPYEVSSKIDLWELYHGFMAFYNQ